MMTELFDRCLNASYIHTDNDGDYAIECDGSTVYILFQWSDSCIDWQSNFDFPAKAYKNAEKTWFAHRGFLRVWKTLRDIIEPQINSLMATGVIHSIVCVGYSHGAAMAGFCTEDMRYLYGDRCLVNGYGFGCPRFTWGILPRAVRRRFRTFHPVRNIPDIVTHLPPAVLLYGFGGRLIKIGKPNKYSPVRAHYPDAYQTELKIYDTGRIAAKMQTGSLRTEKT